MYVAYTIFPYQPMFGKAHNHARPHFSLLNAIYHTGKAKGSTVRSYSRCFITVKNRALSPIYVFVRCFLFYIYKLNIEMMMSSPNGRCFDGEERDSITDYLDKVLLPCLKKQRLLACLESIPCKSYSVFVLSFTEYSSDLYEVN